jgi:hypothetical protein
MTRYVFGPYCELYCTYAIQYTAYRLDRIDESRKQRHLPIFIFECLTAVVIVQQRIQQCARSTPRQWETTSLRRLEEIEEARRVSDVD